MAPQNPQGWYDSLPLRTAAQLATAITAMQELRDAGATWLLNYQGFNGTPENVLDYGLAAEKMGMNLIWPLHNQNLYNGTADLTATFPDMAAASGKKTAAELIPFMTEIVRGLHATKMFYVGDEPPATLQAAAIAHAATVKAQAEPGQQTLLVHTDQTADGGARLLPYADAADVLGLDCYPVAYPWIAQPWTITTFNDAAKSVNAIASAHGKGRVCVAQAFSWAPTYANASNGAPNWPVRWPSVAEYTYMRDNAYFWGNAPAVTLWWARYVMRGQPNDAQLFADWKAGVMAA